MAESELVEKVRQIIETAEASNLAARATIKAVLEEMQQFRKSSTGALATHIEITEFAREVAGIDLEQS